MILEPILTFLRTILGETVMSDALLGGVAQIFALVLVVLFSILIIILPFGFIFRLIKRRKK